MNKRRFVIKSFDGPKSIEMALKSMGYDSPKVVIPLDPKNFYTTCREVTFGSSEDELMFEFSHKSGNYFSASNRRFYG